VQNATGNQIKAKNYYVMIKKGKRKRFCKSSFVH